MANDDQAKALADALMPHLLNSLKKNVIPQLFEEQLGGFKKHAEKLLDQVQDKKRLNDRNGIPFDAGYTQAAEDRQIAFEKKLADEQAAEAQTQAETIERGKQIATGAGAHYISREDARNAAAYRQAKADAAAAGKDLVVGSPAEFHDKHNPQNANSIKQHVVDDPVRYIRYMSRDRFKELGASVANRQAAKDGVQLQFFNSDSDLPDAVKGLNNDNTD